MKKSILVIACAFIATNLFSQHAFEGSWEGRINTGMDLRVIFTISQDKNKQFTAIMDLPDQGMKDIVSKDVLIDNDSVRIGIKEFRGSYAGKLINENTISGNWEQGITTALQLKKIKQVVTVVKPQTPLPPYPYLSEDVIYMDKNDAIQYGATITMPYGKGPFPAVLLLTGSGQQNRDEEIAGHKPFAVLADYLTRQGFAVLRVDDRGMGKTTGPVMTATTLDFAEDAGNSIDYLLTRKEIDKKRIGLLGHSEGGMIAPIVAATRKDITAIVLLAAPGQATADIMIKQNTAFLTATGLPVDYVNSYVDLYTSIIYLMKADTNKDSAIIKVREQVENWIQKTPAKIVTATTGITNEEKKDRFITVMVDAFSSPWMHWFLNYEPGAYLEKIGCKVLAVNGSKDVQVFSTENLAGIKASLENSKSKGFQIKEYEGLNHLFQKCNTCTIREYGKLDETFSTDVLGDIASWLKAAL